MHRWTRTLLIAALAIPSHAPADEYASVRTQFRIAYAAAQAGLHDGATTDSDELRTYPLYPYLQAARLQQQLSADAAIEQFLDDHADASYTRELRSAWLGDLARRNRWETYLEYDRGETETDPALRCHALAARAALGLHDGLQQDIVDEWLKPRSLPEACDPAFDWLRRRNGLTTDLVEQRARLALEGGEPKLARWLA